MKRKTKIIIGIVVAIILIGTVLFLANSQTIIQSVISGGATGPTGFGGGS